jgi:ABC-type branched-subunit amino acid transport system substrate-binding protein
MSRTIVRIAPTLALVTAVAVATAAGSETRATPLRVAILVPKTGLFAAHNVLVASGAQIAADESGSAASPVGKVKVTLAQIQLATDASPIQVMNDLVSRGTQVVVLPCNVDSVPSLAKAGARAGLLMLLPCDPDPRAMQAIPMVWPTAMTGNAEAGQIVNYAHFENAPSAYILSAKGSSYISCLERYMVASAKLDHVQILGRATAALNGSNLGAIAATIKNSRARAIFTAIPSPYAEPLIAGLRRRGLLIQVFGTDGMDADGHYDKYGSLLDDVNIGSFGYPRPTSDAFYNDYRSAFGHDPDGSFPGLGYETIRILESAISQAGSTTPRAIDQAFAKGFAVTGVALEDVTYPGKGSRAPVANAAMARIVRGQHVALFSNTPLGSVPAP